VIEVVAAVIQRDGKYMIARRGPGKHLAGYWEFPGGKVEDSEAPEESLQREMREEFAVHAEIGSYLGDNVHDYGSKVVRLMAYKVTVEEDLHQSTDHDRIEWVEFSQMGNYQLAPADIPLLEYIEAYA
jgi:8-oxo-dGTP diphosphatase